MSPESMPLAVVYSKFPPCKLTSYAVDSGVKLPSLVDFLMITISPSLVSITSLSKNIVFVML